MQNIIENSWFKYLLVLTLFLAYFPFIYHSFFAFPSADDFDYATLGNEYSIDLVLNERYRWNGRYISNFLVLANPIRWDAFLLYQIMPILCLFSVWTSLLLFIRRITKASWEQSFLFASIIQLITLLTLSGVNEAYYWFTGSVTYTLGLCVFLFWVGLVLSNGNMIGIIVLQFLFSGFNEVLALFGMVFLILQLFSRKHFFKYGLLIILQIAVLVYIISAPGNNVRSSAYKIDQNILSFFLESILYFFRFALEWIFSLPSILLGLLILSFPPQRIFKNQFLNSLKLFIFSNLALFLSIAAPIFTTGILGQYRTIHMAGVLYIFTFFYFLISLRVKLKSPLLVLSKQKRVIALFALSLFVWKNSFWGWQDIFLGKTVSYYNEQQSRIQLLNNCKKNNMEVCEVPFIQSKPYLLFTYDIKEDASHWINRSYNHYIDEGELRIVPKSDLTNP